jgi:hypothetical protein
MIMEQGVRCEVSEETLQEWLTRRMREIKDQFPDCPNALPPSPGPAETIEAELKKLDQEYEERRRKLREELKSMETIGMVGVTD